MRNVATHYYTKNFNYQATGTRGHNYQPVNYQEHKQSSTPHTLSNRRRLATARLHTLLPLPYRRKTPTRKKDVTVQLLSATLQLNKKDRMLYVPLQFRQYDKNGLLDTEDLQSAMSENSDESSLPTLQHLWKRTQARPSRSRSQMG